MTDPATAQRQTQPQLELATPGARLNARFLDFVAFFGAALPGLLVYAVLEQVAEEHVYVGVIIAAAGASALLVYNWHLIHTLGQTVGKRWVKLKIVRQDGSPVRFLHGVILREWVVFVVVQFFPPLKIVDLIFIMGAKRRCVHDMIAGTDVISLGEVPHMRRRSQLAKFAPESWKERGISLDPPPRK